MLFDARTLKRVRTFPVGGAAALSPAADEAAFGHADGTVTLLDLALRQDEERSPGSRARASRRSSFSRDGRMLASGAEDGSVGLWSVRTGALRETLNGHSASVQAGGVQP